MNVLGNKSFDSRLYASNTENNHGPEIFVKTFMSETVGLSKYRSDTVF